MRRTDDETVRKLKAKGAETFIGDIMQPESLQGALDGVDTVVHLAAFFRSLRSKMQKRSKVSMRPARKI